MGFNSGFKGFRQKSALLPNSTALVTLCTSVSILTLLCAYIRLYRHFIASVTLYVKVDVLKTATSLGSKVRIFLICRYVHVS